MTKSTTKVAFQPRTLEIEHFFGFVNEVINAGRLPATLHFFDNENPYHEIRSEKMIQDVESTPAYPIVRLISASLILSNASILDYSRGVRTIQTPSNNACTYREIRRIR